MRDFASFVVVDWSGERVARPKGLAVAFANQGQCAPSLLTPQQGWSRAGILDWLLEHAKAGTNMLVGLDLSPGLPFVDRNAYFPEWEDSPADAKTLWKVVDAVCEADDHLAASSVVVHAEIQRHFRHQAGRETICGDLFEPGRGRLRQCETAQKAMGLAPSSCFNLVGAAQVGKSSLTGMRVLNRLRGAIPVWPFDPVPPSGPVIVEIYTSLAAREAGMPSGRSKIFDPDTLDTVLKALGSRAHTPISKYTDHATDALLTTAWLRKVHKEERRWHPPALTPQVARTEGWTFGAL
jgi:hypothetical protein